MNKELLNESINTKLSSLLKSCGYELINVGEGKKCFPKELVSAISEAVSSEVVEHIQKNAKANVTSGSSAGSWSIK